MELYLGSTKVNIAVGNTICSLITPPMVTNDIINSLLSSDNYVLKDCNGITLIPREDGE